LVREPPIPHHRLGRNLQHLCCFLDAQSTEEPKLDDLALSRVLRRKRSKRIVDPDQIVWRLARGGQVRIERYANKCPTALLVLSSPGEVHEHAPHEASSHREKVRAILPLHPTNIHQPEVDLVDECGGLENVARTLARHVPLRKAAQLAVHERKQRLQGSGVAARPFDQKRGHVVGPDVRHSPCILRPRP
jgi:hypothetical protein